MSRWEQAREGHWEREKGPDGLFVCTEEGGREANGDEESEGGTMAIRGARNSRDFGRGQGI